MSRQSKRSIWLGWGFAAVALFGLTDCAQRKGTVDRTQHNIMFKGDLDGEWYFRMTVTEAPFNTGYTMLGDSGKLERGVFEVQEKNLYFFRTYEFIEGGETKGQKPDTDLPYVDSAGLGVGTVRPDPDGRPVACDRKADSVQFCRDQTRDDVALCGLAKDFEAFEGLDATSPVCVHPTLFVYRGAPLAAWPIESHFDIIYDYNPTTGERKNIRLENDSDRMWFERSFMRVDWSRPQVESYEMLSMFHFFNGIADEPVFRDLTSVQFYSVYEGEADAPEHQPVLRVNVPCESDADCDGPAHCAAGRCDRDYMDFSTKHILEPPLTYYEDWDEYVPLCFFVPSYAGGFYECTSEEIRIRSSFLKVDPKDDYVPVDFDDKRLQEFGFFRAERQHYDVEQGSTYSGTYRKAALHRIWEHYKDADGNLLDPSERTPKPVVYYMNQGYDRRLAPQAVELARAWSQPLEEVVRFYQAESTERMFIVCENSNAEAQAAILDIFKEFHADWATLLTDAETDEPRDLLVDDITNSAQSEALLGAIAARVGGHTLVDAANKAFPGYDDHCLDMDQPKRTGDLRYNLLWAVDSPTQAPLYGYGPPSMDPLTGQIINANAYNYSAAMELGAARALMTIEEMLGVMNYRDIMDPNFVQIPVKHTWSQAGRERSNLSDAEAEARAAQMVDPDVAEAVSAMGIEPADQNWAQARLNRIAADPALERELVDDSIRLLFRDVNVGSGTALSDRDLHRMSPRVFANHAAFMNRAKRKIEAAKRTLYLDEFADSAILGLVREYGYRYDAETCGAVAKRHEAEGLMFDLSVFEQVGGRCNVLNAQNAEGWVCHSLCDEASIAAGRVNEVGETCAPCDDVAGNGIVDCKDFYHWVNECTAAKLVEQLRQLIWRTEGIDPYLYYGPDALWEDVSRPDVARTQTALREILDDLRARFRVELLQQIFKSVALHEVGHTLGLRHNFEASTDALNYPEQWWGLRMKPSSENPGQYEDANWDGQTWIRETSSQAYQKMRQLQTSSIMDYGAKFNDYFEGLGHYDRAAIKYGYGDLVEVFEQAPDLSGLTKYARDPRTDQPSNYGLDFSSGDDVEDLFKIVHFTELPNAFGGTAPIYARKNVLRDRVGDDEQRVPYRFCSDELAYQTPTCLPNDAGADPFEITINALDDYEQYWLFAGYGRDSVLFDPENYYERVRSQFGIAARQYHVWAIQYAHYNRDGWWQRNFPDEPAWEQNRNGGLAGSLAATEMFNALAAALARPEPNYYGWSVKRGAYEQVTDWNRTDLRDFFNLAEDQGARPLYAGYAYDGYLPTPDRAGAIYDRLAAFEVLTDPSTNFVGLDEQADTRTYLVNAYTMFPEPTLRLLGGLMTNQVQSYGWCVYQDPAHPNPTGPPTDIVVRNFLENLDCPAGYAPVFPEPLDYTFPTTKFRMPMLAAYYGMSMLINNYDRSFMDVTRVFLRGDRHAIALPDDVEKVEFQNPLSGKIYVAYKTSSGDSTFDPAYFLVNRAAELFAQYPDLEELAERYPNSELEYMVGLLELVRGMHALYDYTNNIYGSASGSDE